jgi:hypothetical protein
MEGCCLLEAGAADFTELIFSASPIVKAVMGLLLLLLGDLVGDHPLQVVDVPRDRETLVDVPRRLRKSAKFSEVQAVCPSLAASPLVGMFQAGYAELTAQLRLPQSRSSPGPLRRVQLLRASRRSTARCCAPRRSK